MTREELDFIGSMNMCDEISNEAYKKIVCHCEGQEPCEDAIGRSDMLDAIGYGTTYTSKELQRIIKALPPVNPQPKTGHWTDIKQYHFYNDGDIETTELMCSCCKETVEWDVELPHKPYHCENCGAKMIEPQEREEV